MEASSRYWAFLSYSHADRHVAARLHRTLESYRIPKRLVGRAAPLGRVPERLHPIFRDRDELTASARIGAVVEEALATSRALIVLCSPAAAASPWVDAEIAAFDRLRPGAPVLCVLLAGEPLASRDPGTAAQECLPPALRPRFGTGVGIADAAPVAVDLRPDRDGWRLGIQKLAAGLAGVPLDQLVQRDAHRRHVRLAWLSAALACVAIALGLLSMAAMRARDEAERQRAEAEGLIAFMLGDLRKRLDPVGRLDVLDAVGARALQYYAHQDPRSLDADALGQRARSQQLIGEIAVRRGDMDDALEAFRNARDTTGELLARHPEDAQRIYDHAQSVFWVGYYNWEHGDTPAGERAMLEYQRLARQLVAQDPTKPAWQAELAYAHNNLGVMLMDQGRAQEATTQFEMSRRANARRVAGAPGDTAARLDLAQDHSWLSSAASLLLRLDDAARLRREEIAQYEAMLRQDPRNAVVMERLMIARRFLGGLLIARGELDAAQREADMASRMAATQLRLEPDNTNWLMAAAKSRTLAAEIRGLQGRPREGLADLGQARAYVATLLARDPERWAWRVETQEGLAHVESDLHRATGQPAVALRVAEASMGRLEALMRTQAQPKTRRWAALSAGRVGRLRQEQGNDAGARDAWRTTLASVGNHPVDADAVAWLVRAHDNLGDRAAAATLRRRLDAAGYRHPDYERTRVARTTTPRLAQGANP